MLVLIGLGLPIVVSVWMLRQLDSAANIRKRLYQSANLEKPKPKILIVDFFSLVFLLQIPFAVLNFSSLEELMASSVIVLLFGIGALLMIWWVALKTVSEAGIWTFRWRALISMVVMPSAFIGCFFFPIGLLNLLQVSGGDFTQLLFLTILSCVGMLISPFIIKHAIGAAEPIVIPEPENVSQEKQA